ncbi:hypothetical protein [Geochorda subterranea]|uniref:Uncharacterized protein n=1 Tax=Geochorda subterranea TaxID=3109564 RepID=A0ABZ1BL07_9FIRM|nr:hypothetical protein [Limnochorda sp. LNt]WRP13502.1 hypothetical protein VLY81_08555 [Limnochorda sp. LNt]
MTALAFGAAGALFAAVYLRGWARWHRGRLARHHGRGGGRRQPRAAAPATVQATGPSAPAIHIVESREAPRLSVSVEWQRRPRSPCGDLRLRRAWVWPSRAPRPAGRRCRRDGAGPAAPSPSLQA